MRTWTLRCGFLILCTDLAAQTPSRPRRSSTVDGPFMMFRAADAVPVPSQEHLQHGREPHHYREPCNWETTF